MNLEQLKQSHPRLLGLYRLGFITTHRLLSAFGYPALLGQELADMKRVQQNGIEFPKPAVNSRRILFVIPRLWSTHALFQTVLAQSLSLRGAQCATVTCGGIMPVCEFTWAEKDFYSPCSKCSGYVRQLAQFAGIQHFSLNEYLDSVQVEQICRQLESASVNDLEKFEHDGIPLGQMSVAPTRWRLRTSEHQKHPQCGIVQKSFIRGGAQWLTSLQKVFKEFNPDTLIMLNGLFMEERVAWSLAKKQNRKCIFFERGRDAGTVFLSHEVAAPRYDISAAWNKIRETKLTLEQQRSIREVMDRRARGEQVVEKYWAVTKSDVDQIRQKLNLDDAAVQKLAVLFTNVSWDTAMQDRETIFTGMFDWLSFVIDLFSKNPDWTLVIRIHPAETQVPGRESYDKVSDWLNQKYNRLPSNVRIVLPTQAINSYVLMSLAKAGLVYASTVGLEMAVKGTPVVVAGTAHYSGKGFTTDPQSKDEFGQALTTLLAGQRSQSAENQIELAERYAHLFFMQRTLPMSVVKEPQFGFPRLTFQTIDELKPGQNHGLDIICDGILRGTEFCQEQ